MIFLWGFLLAVPMSLLLLIDEHPALAPDSAYYLEAGGRKAVPPPFAYRWLLPFVLGTVHNRWRAFTMFSIWMQGGALAWYANDLRAVILVGMLPAVWRFQLRHPVLVDAPGMAVALIGAAMMMHNPPSWQLTFAVVAYAIFGGCIRETVPIWMAVYCWSPWPLIGLLGVLPGALRARKIDPAQDNPWITRPLKTALDARNRQWLNWQLVAVPWGVLLPLGLWHGDYKVWTALVLSHLPWLITSDWNRIAAWAAPVLAVAALSWHSDLWPLLLLIHVFNPYRGA